MGGGQARTHRVLHDDAQRLCLRPRLCAPAGQVFLCWPGEQGSGRVLRRAPRRDRSRVYGTLARQHSPWLREEVRSERIGGYVYFFSRLKALDEDYREFVGSHLSVSFEASEFGLGPFSGVRAYASLLLT